MSVGVPSPGELAQRAEGRRVIAGDGPVGDTELDDAVSRLRESVDAMAGESTGSNGSVGSASNDSGSESCGPDVDAADVIARAHDVHESLQRRLEQAQA